MIKLRSYSKGWAACLLVLYLFIATPVTCWHHHQVQSQSTLGKSGGECFTAAGEDGTNCLICDHQYATVLYADNICLQSPPALKKAFPIFYPFYLLTFAADTAHNKGPPALA